MSVKVCFSKDISLDEIEKKTNLKVRKNLKGQTQIRDNEEKWLGFPNLSRIDTVVESTSFTDMTFYGGNEYWNICHEMCVAFDCESMDEYEVMDRMYKKMDEENEEAQVQADELKELEDGY